MDERPLRVASQSELRAYVRETLCSEAGLDAAQFELVERELVRGSESCGRIFRLHGPRRMQLSAVWDTAAGSLYFYNSAGTRFAKVALAPPVRRAA